MPDLADNGPWSSKWKGFAFALGQGWQGQAHKVTSTSDGKVGVLKLMRTSQGEPKARARMYRESKILERFRNRPNLPRLLDSNCDQFEDQEVSLYFVTHFIGGITLDRYLSMQARLFPDQAIAIVIKLLDTIEFLHGLSPKILHRDIKPKNILMNSKDEPILIDFGIAYTSDSNLNQHSATCNDADQDLEQLTEAGESIGNTFLKLPERSTNRRDSRSDVTLCCGILFYLLTGETPKHLDTLPHRREEMSAILNRLHATDRNIFDDIFDRGFKPSLDQRFQSAEEFRTKLQESIRNLSVVSPLTALTKSSLSSFAPVKPTIADRFISEQGRLNDSLIRLLHLVQIPDSEIEHMTYLQALEASKSTEGFGQTLMIEESVYDDIRQFISKLDNPQPGDDEFFLTWYPAVNDYLELRLTINDDEWANYYHETRE